MAWTKLLAQREYKAVQHCPSACILQRYMRGQYVFGSQGAAHHTPQQGPLHICMPQRMCRRQCLETEDTRKLSPSVIRTKTLRGQEMQQVRGQQGSQKHGAAQGRSITKLSPLNLSCRQAVKKRVSVEVL